MGIRELQEAIRSNNIDMVIQLASQFGKEDIKQVLPEYQEYYLHELTIARGIQDILARTRIWRSKKKIPDTGNYTYELE